MLNLKSADEYKYLNQSNCYSITGVNDAEEFCVVKVLLNIYIFITNLYLQSRLLFYPFHHFVIEF